MTKTFQRYLCARIECFIAFFNLQANVDRLPYKDKKVDRYVI